MKKIVIVDYGVGNLGSLRRAVAQYAPEVVVSEEREVIESADALFLPGVGTFASGMEGLRVRGLIEPIQAAAAKGIPIFGICLGAQLLLERGHEFGEHAGLGIIKGEVVPFPPLEDGATVPAIGWQKVEPSAAVGAQVLCAGLAHPDMYFVHSYILVPAEQSVSLATTVYGGYTYCAVVGSGAVYGTQFHPEKSGQAGLKLIENFIKSLER